MTTTIDAVKTETYNCIEGADAVYANARADGDNLYADVVIGQQYASSVYYTLRSILKFDTSGIPDLDLITQVNMKLALLSDNSTIDDFDIQIVKCNWSDSDPLASGNKDTIFDLILSSSLDDSILRNTSGISVSTYYTSGNLDTGWINKSGYTYYALVSSKDRASSAPGAGNEFVVFDLATNVPQLIIEHAPAISVKANHYKQRMSV